MLTSQLSDMLEISQGSKEIFQKLSTPWTKAQAVVLGIWYVIDMVHTMISVATNKIYQISTREQHHISKFAEDST